MAHSVICPYCGLRFDRDREQYALVGARRYAHAECMLREAAKDPKQKKEIIDPLDNVKCIFCKKPLSKKDPDCILVSEGKYAHKACKEQDDKREKTDKELLDEYIMQLFKVNFVPPKMQKQINSYIESYNYTYSGIRKALYYFYELRGNDIAKAHESLGIVPYIYQEAYRYFYNLWEMKQKNAGIDLQTYVPKEKVIVIPRPQAKIKKRSYFSFLDKEE